MTSFPPPPPLPPPSARLPDPTPRRSGGWLSLVIHVILLLILVEVTRNNVWWDSPMSEGGPSDRVGGGGGGRVVNMIALPEATRRSEPVPRVTPPPPPVPVPVVTPVPVPAPVPEPPVDTLPKTTTGGAVTSGAGGGSAGTTGTGTGPGSGPGSGPGAGGSGTAPPDSARTAARDPEPRQLILIPFDYPPSMRGQTIQVTFFVFADGRVDRVLFSEDIPDRGYAKRLETVMRAYRFRPARSSTGQPVPGHTTVSVTF